MTKAEKKLQVDALLDEKDAIKEHLKTMGKDSKGAKTMRGWRAKVSQALRDLGHYSSKSQSSKGARTH
tara:strand:+ start:97 stop:300 length:204 start_codon:yes stop_codon:yes gene_type:complete